MHLNSRQVQRRRKMLKKPFLRELFATMMSMPFAKRHRRFMKIARRFPALASKLKAMFTPNELLMGEKGTWWTTAATRHMPTTMPQTTLDKFGIKIVKKRVATLHDYGFVRIAG